MSYESNEEKILRLTAAKRAPVKASTTVSIPTGSVATTVSIAVPAGKRYFLKQVNLTKGANTTLSAQQIDGVATEQTASYAVDATFGAPLSADSSVSVVGTNAGASAENLILEIVGYSVDAV